MDDELFWQLTPPETLDVLREYEALDRAENMRAGEIMAAIYNARPRQRGQYRRTLSWRDFFRDDAPDGHDTPDALRSALLSWAARTPGVTVTVQ
jgi:hypothetical protein